MVALPVEATSHPPAPQKSHKMKPFNISALFSCSRSRSKEDFSNLPFLAFDIPALESWFAARSTLDWAHLAHNINVYGVYASNSDGAKPSVYQRSAPAERKIGLPVRDARGMILEYEREWTLPESCVLGGAENPRMARLKCLLELVDVVYTVFPALKLSDRALLRAFWVSKGQSVPKNLKRSKLYRQVNAIDNAREKLARKLRAAAEAKLAQTTKFLEKRRRDLASEWSRVKRGAEMVADELCEALPDYVTVKSDEEDRWLQRHVDRELEKEARRVQRIGYGKAASSSRARHSSVGHVDTSYTDSAFMLGLCSTGGTFGCDGGASAGCDGGGGGC